MNTVLQKAEAQKRLAYLVSKGLHEDVLDLFKKDTLCCSDCLIPYLPTLYTFKEENGVERKWLEQVRQIEEEYDILVYHISHNLTEFGELLNLLYVTSYDEEWEQDWKDLYENCPLSYVINLDEESFSEFGAIGIRVVAGGIIRVA